MTQAERDRYISIGIRGMAALALIFAFEHYGVRESLAWAADKLASFIGGMAAPPQW